MDDEGKKKRKNRFNLKERESGEDRLYAPVCGVVYMRADAEPAPYPQGSSTTNLLRAGFLLLSSRALVYRGLCENVNGGMCVCGGCRRN